MKVSRKPAVAHVLGISKVTLLPPGLSIPSCFSHFDSSAVGDPIANAATEMTRAPGNPTVGGLKVVAASGWFAAGSSGTENIYKIYAESFNDQSYLNAILAEAERIGIL
jgi:phosphoglucomutase